MPAPTIHTVSTTNVGDPATLPDGTKLGVDRVDGDKEISYMKILDAANASKLGLTVNADGSINVVSTLPTDAATQTTVAAILAKLSSDPATQATLAAVLAKLSADPATQTTVAAILAKLSSDPATQTTLAAVAAKDFSTEATLAALSGKVGIPASDDLLTLLRDIKTNTALEATRTESLVLEAEQVNLNTDAVETKIDTTNARIGQVGTAGTLADLLSLVLTALGSVAVTGPLTAAQLTSEALAKDSTVAKDGTDITTPTAMPAGGVGIRGWLSAIWTKLNASLAVTGTFWQATQPVSIAAALTGAAAAIGGWLVATGSIGATKTDLGTVNTPGQVGGWYFFNPNAAVAYVQFFNAQASAVTLGTTAPAYSLGIPGGSGANIAAGLVGLQHSAAISIAVTTTRAGSTGPGATVDYNIFYKQ